MNIPAEVMDRIFKEIMEEHRQLAESTKGEKPTFDNLEGAALRLGKEFERKVLEAALEEEQKKQKGVKKNAKNAVKGLKAMD
ncbi:MAG: hypothetical protein Q8O46_02250 [bacterium]|nr:hypothetical protein [bacterium]